MGWSRDGGLLRVRFGATGTPSQGLEMCIETFFRRHNQVDLSSIITHSTRTPRGLSGWAAQLQSDLDKFTLTVFNDGMAPASDSL